MSRAYVESTLTVHDRVLTRKKCVDLVNQMSKLKGKQTPYDSIYKLELDPRKANNNVDCLIWFMRCTNELIIEDQVGAGELTFKTLSGKGLPGGKGVLDMFKLKWECLNAMMSTCLEELKITTS